MNVYKKVYIELTEEEKDTLIKARSVLEDLYLNDLAQEAVDNHIQTMYSDLERLVSALEDIIDYLCSQYI